MSKYLVLDKSQLARPVEIAVEQGEYGLEIEVTRGDGKTARVTLDYFAGKLRVKQFGHKDYSMDAELGRLEIQFQ